MKREIVRLEYHDQSKERIKRNFLLVELMREEWKQQPGLQKHSRSVAAGMKQLARLYREYFPEVSIDLAEVEEGGLLHDIGKHPYADILKEEELSTDELAQIREHAHAGYLYCISEGMPRRVALVPWQHHENWDGSGYPQHLKGQEIDIYSRIARVVDYCDTALHRYERSERQVQEELFWNSGILFDPEVAEICLENFGVIVSAMEENPEKGKSNGKAVQSKNGKAR